MATLTDNLRTVIKGLVKMATIAKHGSAVVKIDTQPSKIAELAGLCAAGVALEINPHKNYYDSVQQYLTDKVGEPADDIDIDIYNQMIKQDCIIEIQFYQHSPIGFDVVYHHNLNEALNQALELALKRASE